MLIIFLISLIIPIAISFNKETKTSNEQLKYSDAQNDNVIFEGVGSYAFATAGSNNAYRGPTVEKGYTWITAFSSIKLICCCKCSALSGTGFKLGIVQTAV